MGPRAREKTARKSLEQGGVLGDVLAARGDAQRDGVRRGGRPQCKGFCRCLRRRLQGTPRPLKLNREPEGGDSRVAPERRGCQAASPSRASIDEMAAVVGRVDADDADREYARPAAGLSIPATHPNPARTRSSEYRLLRRGTGGRARRRAPRAGQLERGEVKRCPLETRLALGLSETAETARALAPPPTLPSESVAHVAGGSLAAPGR